MPEVVAVTAVPSEQEAEVVCALLRSGGIKCGYRRANMAASLYGSWKEILVAEGDAEAARELIAATPVVDEPTGYY